jgi:hypothetical protein
MDGGGVDHASLVSDAVCSPIAAARELASKSCAEQPWFGSRQVTSVMSKSTSSPSLSRRPQGDTPHAASHGELMGAFAVAVGLVVGGLTSIGQTHLPGALNALVNSASAWLVAPLLIGRTMRTARGAAGAGLAVALAQLVGYYVVARVRGYSGGGSIVAFWGACALVGGPLFGAGGYLWRTGRPGVSGLGSTLLPAAFLAEGLWVYVHELHYWATAALWIGIGISLGVAMPRGHVQRRWLALTLTLGIVGEIIVGQIYLQAA